MLANFERLVRSALAAQDSSSPQVRQVIYQSSRNALQKIIDNNRSLTVEKVMEQKRHLEGAIEAIEAEYINPAPQPEPINKVEEVAQQAALPQTTAPQTTATQITEPEAPQPAFEEPVFEEPVRVDTRVEETIIPEIAQPAAVEDYSQKPPQAISQVPQVSESDPLHEIQQILESTNPRSEQQVEPVAARQPEPQLQPDPVAQSNIQAEIQPEIVQPTLNDDSFVGVDAEERYTADSNYEQPENVPLGFTARRKKQKRFIWTALILIILALLAYIAYIIISGVMSSSLLSQTDTNGPKLNPNSITRQAEADNYITVLQAKDTSALITAGRGKAEIVKELNTDMLRVNSVRDALNRSEPALPLLIRLKPGVLQQISGKRVTVEIFAKSGASEKASYAVGCEFGNLSACGRKRFLVGSQPEASVFAFQMDTVTDVNQDMFISLSTDTTSEAAITGKGDVLDILYVRLRADD